MNTEEYVTLQVERTRGQLRATAFLRLSNNSLALRGKTHTAFATDLLSVGKKSVELIDAESASSTDNDPMEGDIVSVEHVFASNEGMIWEGTEIRFLTPQGVTVSPDQFEYLKTRELGVAQIFAETEQFGQSVKSVWKNMSRVAREARCDKAKEIFYITFGELIWEWNKGKKDARQIKSPLFIMPIREEATSSGLFKFKISQPRLKQNSVLRREVLKQTGVNIYGACEEEIALGDIERALAETARTVKDYVSAMRVEANAYHICILDSHDEGICQAVERNMDAIVRSKLTQVLSGEHTYDEIFTDPSENIPAIFPLPADESQKKVIERVLCGQSLFAPAPAGAGKSQTSVNIAANLAIQGKSVYVLSEKLAANEVFLNYASRVGLNQYCLSINSDMRTADIVRQIKSIAKITRQYVHTSRARETVKQYREAVGEYERLNRELYRTDPTLQLSLYELISIAVSATELTGGFDSILEKRDYIPLKETLFETEASCFGIMTDGEFTDYFYHGSCTDPELRSMLERAMEGLKRLGVDLPRIIRENDLGRDNAVQTVLAHAARQIALAMIGERDLCEVGNRRVKAIYKRLVDTHLQMQELYTSYLHQELSARIVSQIDDQFIATLEKLRVSKVTPQELFAVYGKEILSMCPIIVTTPTAAADYIYGTGLDHFHTMIIDEASQMQIISILPYVDRVKQMVVFGDSMQLGITSIFMKKDLVSNEDAIRDTAQTDRSVLQAVQGRFPSYGLNYHYRSETEMLIHVSNKTCYDNLLETVPDIYTERSTLPPHLGFEMIRVEPPEPTKRGENENEAREIAIRVAALQEEYPEKSIGIIAFNERQQEMISDMLDEELEGYVDNDRLWVRSLENAQGKEADFIFISIGHFRRNRDGSLHKGISEINRAGGENRLNVLFTRARCKNFIVISFDYCELKKSENTGVRRLYEYLDYAANGSINEPSASRSGNADHAMVRRMSDMLESLDPRYRTRVRIGSENMAVDIALRENGNSCYSLGILMPSIGLTPQQTMTKVLVLERVGWHISPVSPIYFLVSQAAFQAQLERDIREPITFTGGKRVCFDTNTEPDTRFDMREFALPCAVSEDNGETPLSEADFLAMDFRSCYDGVLKADYWQKDVKALNILAKAGDSEANLVLLISLKDRFIAEGKRRAMLTNVSRLYAVQNERKACFLFAQMLRMDDVAKHGELIRRLLVEAKALGIGGGASC